MNYFSKKLIFTLPIFFIFHSNLNSDVPYFVDFKYILNESKAGKEAQIYLKKKLTNGIKQLKDKEKAIQKAEKKIIEQKKLLSAEEYKKKVSDLSKKESLLQKERDTLLDSVAKQRTKARNELLINLNPIIKEYMNEKKIRMVSVTREIRVVSILIVNLLKLFQSL